MTQAPQAARPSSSLPAALAVAFALRAAVGLALNVDDGIHRGFDFYGFMADHVLDGRGLVWSFYDGLGEKWANRAPLYPLLVAAARFVAGRGATEAVVIAQAAVGAAACLVPAALARRWGGDRAAIAAVWIAAAWPYSVILDTGLVEHVVFAPLALAAVLLTLRASDAGGVRGSALAGAFAGLATLARLTFGASVAFVAAALLARRGGFARVALFALGATAVLLPWVARNHEVTGAWTIGTDGGRALWVGNSAATFHGYPAESIDKVEREMFRGFSPEQWRELRAKNDDEVGQERLFRDRAIASIAERPAAAAWGAVRKAAALWSPVMNPGPTGAPKLVVFGLCATSLFGAALAAAAALPRLRTDLPVCLAVAFSFTLIGAVFWGQSRYLAPLHGLLIAAAAAWIATLVRSREPAA